jgi:hypothetical protein
VSLLERLVTLVIREKGLPRYLSCICGDTITAGRHIWTVLFVVLHFGGGVVQGRRAIFPPPAHRFCQNTIQILLYLCLGCAVIVEALVVHTMCITTGLLSQYTVRYVPC